MPNLRSLGAKACLLFAFTLGITTWTQPASAHIGFGSMSKSMYGGGVNLGISTVGNVGFVGGLEGSWVYLHKSMAWGGGYADVVYDVSARQTRFSLGPEFGFGP